MPVVLATRNAHKLREFQRLLPDADLEPLPEEVELPPETGETFEENALIKARAAADATHRPAIADDSGIEAEALGGRPGVRSARYAGEHATDGENLDKLRDPDRVGAWLATTARRECQRTLIRTRRVLPTDDDWRLEPRYAAVPTPEVVALASERDRLLWMAFAQLSEQCQRLLRILMVASPSYEVVAEALGMPIGSIGPTRARCLERLRRRLSASGISADVGDS